LLLDSRRVFEGSSAVRVALDERRPSGDDVERRSDQVGKHRRKTGNDGMTFRATEVVGEHQAIL
jgi:hypothetical protein